MAKPRTIASTPTKSRRYSAVEKNLHRRAKELGNELKPIVATVTMPDGEVVTAKPNGEIVMA